MQAKHIDTDELLTLLLIMSRVGRRHDQPGRWVMTHEVWAVWNDQQALTPFKVMAAKLSGMMRHGLLTGCNCGCHGGWELTQLGLARLIERGLLVPA